jgi:hypothetical protein
VSRNEDIDNAIWADPDFDALSPDAALLYLWSFTNPRCGMAGIYRVPERQLLEGRLPPERLAAALAELADSRFAFYEQGIFWVRTRARYLRTKGQPMMRSIELDLGKIPTDHPLLVGFIAEYGESWFSGVLEGFGGGSEGVQENGPREGKVRTPPEPLEGFKGKGKGNSKGFGSWLEHYKTTTGKTSVRGSKPARDAFAARLAEGRSLDDLKLATVGCHGDSFCREGGHDIPETILRASKVERYVELGRKHRPEHEWVDA